MGTFFVGTERGIFHGRLLTVFYASGLYNCRIRSSEHYLQLNHEKGLRLAFEKIFVYCSGAGSDEETLRSRFLKKYRTRNRPGFRRAGRFAEEPAGGFLENGTPKSMPFHVLYLPTLKPNEVL